MGQVTSRPALDVRKAPTINAATKIAVLAPNVVAAVAFHGPDRVLATIQPIVKRASLAVIATPSAVSTFALETPAIPNYNFSRGGAYKHCKCDSLREGSKPTGCPHFDDVLHK
ncbi:hypothetical protein BGZ93_010505 [Podila epicladia]|nr:hypothetical protein BGZ93_010505 [Podila epicladia]